ncbi:MAG: ribbon-helix-helix protein, CopG family [Spirochaetia bacterium]|nr:ribbon-helix-helix protein, CopG family [Spirochaetia bacterium]
MAELTRRLQILLDPEQMEYLQTLSKQRRKSVAELIRESVDIVYRPRSDLGKKRALADLRAETVLKIEPGDLLDS